MGLGHPVSFSEWRGVVGNRIFQLHSYFINPWPYFYGPETCWYSALAVGYRRIMVRVFGMFRLKSSLGTSDRRRADKAQTS